LAGARLQANLVHVNKFASNSGVLGEYVRSIDRHGSLRPDASVGIEEAHPGQVMFGISGQVPHCFRAPSDFSGH
jgi:hypothetical protein